MSCLARAKPWKPDFGRASAYYQRAIGVASARQPEDERLGAAIREVHMANYEAYGYQALGRRCCGPASRSLAAPCSG